MWFFSKKQIFLLGIIMGSLGAMGSYGTSFHPVVQKALDTFHQATTPVTHHMKCYTTCNQKIGRQGAGAFQDYFRQHADRPEKEVLAALRHPAGREVPEIEKEARQALCCLTNCRVSMTVRFLAQFLGSLEDEAVVRMVGVLFGAAPRYAPSHQAPQVLAGGKGEETKLYTVVFNQRFHQGCERVLRHEGHKIKRFKKTLELLRQVYFEMYGPVRMAPHYVEKYGV
jgi:hypothetical protein